MLLNTTIITIAHQHYTCPNITIAARIVELLAHLRPVECSLNNGEITYEPTGGKIACDLLCNQSLIVHEKGA